MILVGNVSILARYRVVDCKLVTGCRLSGTDRWLVLRTMRRGQAALVRGDGTDHVSLVWETRVCDLALTILQNRTILPSHRSEV